MPTCEGVGNESGLGAEVVRRAAQIDGSSGQSTKNSGRAEMSVGVLSLRIEDVSAYLGLALTRFCHVGNILFDRCS